MLGGWMRIKLGDADQRSKAPCPQIIAWSPLSLIYLADANENLSVGFTVRGMPTRLEPKKCNVKGRGRGRESQLTESKEQGMRFGLILAKAPYWRFYGFHLATNTIKI
ncbi:hypothetical protein TNCV_2794651 [Trichonephila clavipes]|nr:hypothetical protein TNCV_2794651 [Trichonephila clavipes]